MSSQLITYILPARHQLQYLMEHDLPDGYYLDNLIMIALCAVEVEYDACAWEVLWDDLYTYATIIASNGSSEEYDVKHRHHYAMQEASKAEAFVHLIIEVLKSHLFYILGNDFLESHSIRNVHIGAGDLVLTYETVEPSVRTAPHYTGASFSNNGRT